MEAGWLFALAIQMNWRGRVAPLAQEGIDCVAFPCDVSNRSEAEALVARVIERFGRIDVLVNNAGHIQVAPYENFEPADYERAMDVMFWAPVYLTFAILPHYRKVNAGHIVNITSVGGRVSIPHLLPYSCAKFALVGFSTGLSAELRSQGPNVLTVIPGLMRTGSYLNAEFKGAQKREFAWFALLGNLPGFSVAADYAARSIRRALQNKQQTCTISLPAKLLIASEAVLPESTRFFLSAASRLLPEPTASNKAATGRVLNREFSPIFDVFTSLGRTAAGRLNE